METDDRALADLGMERYEKTLEALYHAQMRCLDDDQLRHLCSECGISYDDLARYVPPILRGKSRLEWDRIPFPF